MILQKKIKKILKKSKYYSIYSLPPLFFSQSH